MHSRAKRSITPHLSQATRNEKKRKRVPTDEIYFVKFAQPNQYAVPKAERNDEHTTIKVASVRRHSTTSVPLTHITTSTRTTSKYKQKLDAFSYNQRILPRLASYLYLLGSIMLLRNTRFNCGSVSITSNKSMWK